MNLPEFVSAHTYRSVCQCGLCIDVGTALVRTPPAEAHTADLAFFKVSLAWRARGIPKMPLEEMAAQFRQLTAEHEGEFAACDPLDGHEHDYIALGAWIGDQGLAMQYMGLGALLGVFTLHTPRSMLPDDQITDEEAVQLAGVGLLTVQAIP